MNLYLVPILAEQHGKRCVNIARHFLKLGDAVMICCFLKEQDMNIRDPWLWFREAPGSLDACNVTSPAEKENQKIGFLKIMFQSLTSQAMLSHLDVLLHLVFLLLDDFTPGNGEMSTSFKGRVKQTDSFTEV